MLKGTNLVIVITVLASVIILVLGILLITKTQPPLLEGSNGAKIELLTPLAHDFGEINIDGGLVEQVFKIKNGGNAPIEIANFKTSCMCTEAQVSINGENSPIFGMNTRSVWKGVVNQGEIADIKVVYDPMFHGPDGVGVMTRMVTFNTNDLENESIEFRIEANVVRSE